MNFFPDHTSGLLHRWLAVAVLMSVFLWRANAADAPAAAPAATPAEDKTAWHGDVALGLSVTQGNSKTLTTHGSATANKLLKSDEFRFNADFSYGLNNFGETNEERNAENFHGVADYKHLFTERFFGNLHLDAYHDDVADIQNREIFGPAVGYYFIKSEATRLSAEIGGSYEHLRQNGSDANFFTARAGERGEHEFGKVAKIWESLNYFPKVDDVEQYLLVAEVGAEATVTSRLLLRVVFQDNYNSRPAPDKVPNDLAIITSIAYKY